MTRPWRTRSAPAIRSLGPRLPDLKMLLPVPPLVLLSGTVLELFVIKGKNVGGIAVLVAATLAVLIVYCDGFIKWRRKRSEERRWAEAPNQ